MDPTGAHPAHSDGAAVAGGGSLTASGQAAAVEAGEVGAEWIWGDHFRASNPAKR